MNTKTTERVALVTGGSAGLGLALTRALADAGWRVITDGRSAEKFKEADLPDGVTVVVGDLTDADHRAELLRHVAAYGRLDLLVHNASTLGPLPMKALSEVDIADLQQVWRTNIGGPLVSRRRCCRGCARRTAYSSRSAPTPRSTTTRRGGCTAPARRRSTTSR